MTSDSADLAGRIKFNKDKKEVFAFGKHKDKVVTEVFEKNLSYFMNGLSNTGFLVCSQYYLKSD